MKTEHDSRDGAAILLYLVGGIATKGSDMFHRARSTLWVVLIGAIVFGALLIWASDCAFAYIPYAWFTHLIKELGSAAVIAAILGLTVDIFLKTELSKDVFQAAFSYLLPNELKQEVARIIEYKFLCVKHFMIIEIVKISENPNTYRLSVNFERQVKNISHGEQKICNKFALDEWGYTEKSRIVCCYLRYGDEKKEATQNWLDKQHAIGKKTDEISLRAGDSVTMVSKGYEIKGGNSELMMSFVYPTVDPEAEIRLPPELAHEFNFGAPAANTTVSKIGTIYRLSGTHFPGQFMRLRWWPVPSNTETTAGHPQLPGTADADPGL